MVAGVIMVLTFEDVEVASPTVDGGFVTPYVSLIFCMGYPMKAPAVEYCTLLVVVPDTSPSNCQVAMGVSARAKPAASAATNSPLRRGAISRCDRGGSRRGSWEGMFLRDWQSRRRQGRRRELKSAVDQCQFCRLGRRCEHARRNEKLTAFEGSRTAFARRDGGKRIVCRAC